MRRRGGFKKWKAGKVGRKPTAGFLFNSSSPSIRCAEGSEKRWTWRIESTGGIYTYICREKEGEGKRGIEVDIGRDRFNMYQL